jgi:hypothetical protein
MPNRPDIPETGRIQLNQEQTDRNPKLSYATDVRRHAKLGANVDADSHPPQQEKALRDAIAKNIGMRRGDFEEKLPTDPLDEEISAPGMKKPKPRPR